MQVRMRATASISADVPDVVCQDVFPERNSRYLCDFSKPSRPCCPYLLSTVTGGMVFAYAVSTQNASELEAAATSQPCHLHRMKAPIALKVKLFCDSLKALWLLC